MNNDDVNDFIRYYGIKDIQRQYETESINSYTAYATYMREDNVVITMDYHKFKRLVNDSMDAMDASDRMRRERLLHDQYPNLKEAYAHYKTLLALMQHAT
jgi:hypothetical protein